MIDLIIIFLISVLIGFIGGFIGVATIKGVGK